MGLMWRYAEACGNPLWKGMTWAMVPALGSATCACTWHFFYNSPDLEFLVALQVRYLARQYKLQGSTNDSNTGTLHQTVYCALWVWRLGLGRIPGQLVAKRERAVQYTVHHDKVQQRPGYSPHTRMHAYWAAQHLVG